MWTHQTTEITEIPESALGFIYKITNILDNRKYVGRKMFSSNRKVRLTKKEKLLPENKRKTFKRVIKETDWKDYWGSSDELKADIKSKGMENFKREILCFCNTKTDLSFWEVYHQITSNVLFDDSYNKNILGKFYKGKVNNLLNNL